MNTWGRIPINIQSQDVVFHLGFRKSAFHPSNGGVPEWPVLMALWWYLNALQRAPAVVLWCQALFSGYITVQYPCKLGTTVPVQLKANVLHTCHPFFQRSFWASSSLHSGHPSSNFYWFQSIRTYSYWLTFADPRLQQPKGVGTKISLPCTTAVEVMNTPLGTFYLHTWQTIRGKIRSQIGSILQALVPSLLMFVFNLPSFPYGHACLILLSRGMFC